MAEKDQYNSGIILLWSLAQLIESIIHPFLSPPSLFPGFWLFYWWLTGWYVWLGSEGMTADTLYRISIRKGKI